jgi:hypothetical protein
LLILTVIAVGNVCLGQKNSSVDHHRHSTVYRILGNVERSAFVPKM